MKSQKIDWLALSGLALTLIFVFIAEVWRFKGFLLVDLWVPVFTLSFLGWRWIHHELKLHKTVWPAAIFVALGFASLLLHSADMSLAAFAKAAFYGVRWFCLFLLSVVAFQLNDRSRHILLWMIFILATLLAIAGFIQLKIYPDFGEEMTVLGWDPHKGRLLSTWFDPNFVGGFLAFALCFMTTYALDKPSWRIPLAPLMFICVVALALTLSRSSYLALLAGIGVIAILRARWLIPAGIGLVILALTLSPTVRDRSEDLVDTIQTTLTEDTYLLPDPSSRERFGKWEEGWTLFMEHPLIGQGYNRYADAALELGTIKDLTQHDTSGNDSTLLTLLALTGVLGFLPWLALHFILLHHAWQYREHPQSLGFLAGTTGLFIHSIFVNSLLFPLLLVPFWLCSLYTHKALR